MEPLSMPENELVPAYTTSTGEKVVYGTDLHKVLEVRSRYRDWGKNQLNDIGTIGNEDFAGAENLASSWQMARDRIICQDTTKEMAMMNSIFILDISNEAASKAKGLVLKEWLERLLSLKAKNITVDFRRITHFACPFFNYSFAALALIYGFDTIHAIQIKNISQIGLATYLASMKNAEMVSRHPEHIVEVSQIIDDTPKKVMP